jgi:type III pantothenate kinase
MNLAVDIGNTHIKLGIFSKSELEEVFLNEHDIDLILAKYKIRHVIISSSGSGQLVQQKLQEKKITPLVVSHLLKLPLIIQYKTPETLGADRIAGSVAAKALYPQSAVLKIDFGTCITYDVVTEKNEYLGGAISPGMMMRFKALHNYTARLPLVDPMQFIKFELTGQDTASAIASGVVNGMRAEADGIIKEYNARFGNLKIVATGGDSGFFVTLLKNEIFARPNLVLEGLNRILNDNI